MHNNYNEIHSLQMFVTTVYMYGEYGSLIFIDVLDLFRSIWNYEEQRNTLSTSVP